MSSIYRGWRVVIASVAGLMVSPAPIGFYSIGVLMLPLQTRYGWNTSQLSLLVTILTVSIVAAMPLVGMAIDRYGAKQVLLPSMVAFAVAMTIAGTMRSLGGLYFAYALIGISCAGANSVPYMRAISAWFDRRRGLAVGIASAGMGAGFAVIPAFTQYFERLGGPTAAYFALGALILCAGVPVVFLWFENGPRQADLLSTELKRESGEPAEEEGGASGWQAVRMRQFWTLLILFCCSSGTIYGAAIHLVPAIQRMQTSLATAVFAATMFGVAATVGRIVAGWLCDRVFPAYVTCGVFLGGALGIVILGIGPSGRFAVLAATLVGFCSGAEGDMLALLCSRYFGQRAFGRIYGHLFSATLVGISVIPYLIGVGFDFMKGYRIPLILVALALCVSAFLALTLGAYPTFDRCGLILQGRGPARSS